MEKTSNKGFTLIEIMMVLTIMGIILYFTFLPENFVINCRFDSVIDRLVINLRWARMKAILDNRDYNFKIYAEDNNYDGKCKYIIYYESEDHTVIIRKGEYPAEYTLYKDLHPVKINSEFYDRIKFTCYGTAVNGTIGLENESGNLTKVVVSQMGRIRIEED